MSFINTVECYIDKIYNVTTLPFDPPQYKVDLIYDCYGSKHRATVSFTEKEWLATQERGYFWG